FFFFSSRRRHTRSTRDWSSDVCSSDLALAPDLRRGGARQRLRLTGVAHGRLLAPGVAGRKLRRSIAAVLRGCAHVRVCRLDAPSEHPAAARRNGVSVRSGRKLRPASLTGDRDRVARACGGISRGEALLMRCAVVGAGAWGTALADLLACNGHAVRLWALEAEVARSINERRENPIFLPGFSLAKSLQATTDEGETVREAELVVYATPSQHLRGVVRAGAAVLRKDAVLAVASKGIEQTTLALMS